MSWNLSLIGIQEKELDAYALGKELGLSLDEPLGTTSWFDATSSTAMGTSVGVVKGWTVLCDPCAFLNVLEPVPPEHDLIWSPVLHDGLCRLSQSGLAVGFIVSGVSDTYAFTLYRNGRLERCRLLQEGATLIDAGKPSEEESAAFAEESDEEQRVFALLDKFGLPLTALDSASFTMYSGPR